MQTCRSQGAAKRGGVEGARAGRHVQDGRGEDGAGGAGVLAPDAGGAVGGLLVAQRQPVDGAVVQLAHCAKTPIST